MHVHWVLHFTLDRNDCSISFCFKNLDRNANPSLVRDDQQTPVMPIAICILYYVFVYEIQASKVLLYQLEYPLRVLMLARYECHGVDDHLERYLY